MLSAGRLADLAHIEVFSDTARRRILTKAMRCPVQCQRTSVIRRRGIISGFRAVQSRDCPSPTEIISNRPRQFEIFVFYRLDLGRAHPKTRISVFVDQQDVAVAVSRGAQSLFRLRPRLRDHRQKVDQGWLGLTV